MRSKIIVTQKSNYKKPSAVILAIYGLSLVVAPVNSWALVITPSGSPTPEIDCDQFCAKFNSYGFYSDNTWNKKNTWSETGNDQLCADLGAPVTNAYQSPTPSASTLSLSCVGVEGITMSDSVQALLNSKTSDVLNIPESNRCLALSDMKDLCTMHNSSVEKYCLAYNAIGGGKTDNAVTMQGVMLGLDGAAMGACWLACALPNPATMAICAAAGAASTGMEIGMQVQLRSSKINQYISATNEAINGLQIGSMAVSGVAGAGAIANAGGAIASMEKVGAMDNIKTQRGLSCTTATMYTILFALRAANLGLTVEAKNNACTNISKHITGDDGSTSIGSGSGNGNGSTGSIGGGGGGGGFTSGGTGGDTGALGLSGRAMDEAMGCLTGNTFSGCGLNSGQSSQGAVDANAFQNSGGLAPLATMIPNPSALAEKALREGAGSAAASILPGQLGGDLGNAIAGLAQAAQDDASKISDLYGISPSSAYTGGGGGGSGSGGGSGAGALGGLFGNSGGFGNLGGKGMQGPGLASFGEARKGPDIWHSNTKETLFQIISGKMSQVTERLK